MDTRDLKTQHEVARSLADQIRAQVERSAEQPDVLQLVRLLTKLNGLLRVHFAQEDCLLYPAMIAGRDRSAARLAQQYQAEMGGLAQQFETYMRCWLSSAAILAAFAEFRADTLEILAALDARIEREDQLLYPLADRALGGRAAAA